MSTGNPPPPPGYDPTRWPPQDAPPTDAGWAPPQAGPPQSGPPYGAPPYAGPPAPPPAYGPYGMPYGYLGREHPQGVTILILGIVGLVFCQLTGPFAWVMGNRAIAEIDADPMAYSNRSTVQAGRICGIVATGILALYLVGLLIFIVAAVATSST